MDGWTDELWTDCGLWTVDELWTDGRTVDGLWTVDELWTDRLWTDGLWTDCGRSPSVCSKKHVGCAAVEPSCGRREDGVSRLFGLAVSVSCLGWFGVSLVGWLAFVVVTSKCLCAVPSLPSFLLK